MDRTVSNGSSRRMSVVVQRLHYGTTRIWSHSGGGWLCLLLLLLLCLTTTTAVGAVVAAFFAPSRFAAAPSHSSSSTITTTTTAGSIMFAVPRIFRVEHLSFRRRQRFSDNWKSKGRIRNVVPPQPYDSTVLSLSQWKSSLYDEHDRSMRQQQRPLSLNTVTVEARDDNNSDWRREWGVFDYYTTQQQPAVVTTMAQQREGNHDYNYGRTRTTATTTTTTLECPETIRAVVQASAAAICAALCHHYEPEQAQAHPKGQMAQPTKSTSRHHHHHHHQLPPSSFLPRDYINSGRIGIEVDFGGGHDDDGDQESSRTAGRRTSSHNEAATVRYAALLLAARLAQDIAWQPYESTTSTTTLETPLSPPLPPPRLRPIAVYFNTVQQALAASQQLLQLKRIEWHRHTMDAAITSTTTTSRRPATVYDSILIRCLCQGDSIPNEMLRYYAHEEMENISNSTIPSNSSIGTKDKSTSRLYRAKKSAARVDPTAGLLLIVQPTDYNTDFEPQPGPVLSAAQALQQLAMRASLEQLGMVLLSPRFVNYPATDCSNCLVVSSHGTGWDERRRPLSPLSPLESGKQKFAQSSSFAGLEPPRGATPWILRDFGPPIFTWVAHTLPLESRSTTFTSLRQRRSLETSLRCEDDSKATHLVLWQSILHPDAAWHLFAVSAPKVESRSRSSCSSGVRVRYIASTKSATGRPTRDILRRLYLDHLLCCTT
jgi:hypothetical protein